MIAEQTTIMMRLGQIQLLCLLLPLCTVVIGSAIKGYEIGSEKPGNCPPERYYNKSKDESCLRPCKNDNQCDGNMKCCLDNCHMICKPPAQEKPGECPGFVSHAVKCADNCTSDSECPGHYKCCLKSCGKTCVPTLSDLAKPNMEPRIQRGFCPQEEILNCSLPERASCDDFSCIDGYKCCPMICRRECRKALEERAGNCPAADTACPTGTENTSCQSDYDCKTFHKCCSTKCGKKCVKAENIPPVLHY